MEKSENDTNKKDPNEPENKRIIYLKEVMWRNCRVIIIMKK